MASVQVTKDFPQGGIAHMRLDSREDFELFAKSVAGFRQDVGLTVAFARSLEHIFAKAYEALFAQFRAHEFFPTNTEVDAGAMSYTYRMLERIGQAAVIDSTGTARNLPAIDVGAQEWQQPVITLGASYNFTRINQLSGAMMNFSIEAEKAKATREAFEQLEEQIYCTGLNATMGVVGVTTAPGVATVTQVSTGTWISQILTGLGTAPLTSTLVAALGSDLLKMKFQVGSLSLGRHRATNCLLPTNLYFALDIVPESPLFNSKTLLTWLEELTGLDIDDWAALNSAGLVAGSPLSLAAVSGGNPQQNTRVMVYEKSPEVVQLIQVQPFVQLAPQMVGLNVEVPCYSRIGGAMAIRPLGAVILDGLLSSDSNCSAEALYDGKDIGCLGFAGDSVQFDGMLSSAV